MDATRAAFSGIVGFRRRPWNIFGVQARVATIGDGTLRVVDAEGREELAVALTGAVAVLKRGIVRIDAAGERFCLYGFSTSNKLPPALVDRLAPAETVVVPSSSSPLVAARASRAILEALRDGGADGP